jgi:hypothetical protein
MTIEVASCDSHAFTVQCSNVIRLINSGYRQSGLLWHSIMIGTGHATLVALSPSSENLRINSTSLQCGNVLRARVVFVSVQDTGSVRRELMGKPKEPRSGRSPVYRSPKDSGFSALNSLSFHANVLTHMSTKGSKHPERAFR